MNARCYRCGWSFSLSREAIEAAVTAANAQGETFHVEPCPRCKLSIKLPLDQLRHGLPADWTPGVAAEPSSAAPEATPPAAGAAEPAAPAEAEAKEKPRHHRRSAHKAE